MLRGQRLEGRQHQAAQHRVGRRDAHPARELALRAGRRRARGFELAFDALGMARDLQHRVGRQVAAAAALEQALAEMLLHALHRAKDGGGVRAQARRRFDQRAAAGEREQHLEVGGREFVLRRCNG